MTVSCYPGCNWVRFSGGLHTTQVFWVDIKITELPICGLVRVFFKRGDPPCSSVQPISGNPPCCGKGIQLGLQFQVPKSPCTCFTWQVPTWQGPHHHQRGSRGEEEWRAPLPLALLLSPAPWQPSMPATPWLHKGDCGAQISTEASPSSAPRGSLLTWVFTSLSCCGVRLKLLSLSWDFHFALIAL